MIQIDIDMPKNCMCCPFPSVGTDYYYCYCPGVDGRAYDFKQAESIPDDCPLHEVQPDPDTVSRQQAIDAIRKIILGFFSDEDGTMTDTEKTLLSVNKAICNELAKLPPSPTVTNEDTVSRQDVINIIEHYCDNGCEIAEDNWCPDCQQSNFVKMIKELPPSPTPSRPHDISKAKFSCPICGAEMEVTVDEWDEGGAV